MANETDSGLVKRGFALLAAMVLLVGTVLFILLQGRSSQAPPAPARAEDVALSVPIPSAAYPASISWAALYQLSEHMPSPVGWEIRQNALATLARRGSDHVPWRQYAEMLNVDRATANARAQLANVPEEFRDPQETSEGAARKLVVIGLKALAEWHTKRREANKTDIPDGLLAVYAAVDRLAESPVPEIREQAKKTQETFFRS
jgi:hypothetical protein